MSSAKVALPVAVRVLLLTSAAVHILAGLLLVPSRGGDFHGFYESAKHWNAGGTFYPLGIGDPSFVNLSHPAMVVVFWPFLALSSSNALFAWTLLSLALAWGLARVVSGVSRLSTMDALLMLSASNATLIGLLFGQVAFVVAALVTIAWLALREDRLGPAGVALGVAVVLKPFLGIVALYVMWRHIDRAREWLVWLMTSVIAVSASAALLVGLSGYGDWIATARRAHFTFGMYNASVWGIGARTLDELPPEFEGYFTPIAVQPRIALGVGALLSGAALTLAWRTRTRDIERGLSIVGLIAILVFPLGWIYYLPVFAGPILTTLARAPRRWHWGVGFMATIPYTVLGRPTHGVWSTLTVGQLQCFSMALLLAAVIQAPDNECAGGGS